VLNILTLQGPALAECLHVGCRAGFYSPRAIAQACCSGKLPAPHASGKTRRAIHFCRPGVPLPNVNCRLLAHGNRSGLSSAVRLSPLSNFTTRLRTTYGHTIACVHLPFACSPHSSLTDGRPRDGDTLASFLRRPPYFCSADNLHVEGKTPGCHSLEVPIDPSLRGRPLLRLRPAVPPQAHARPRRVWTRPGRTAASHGRPLLRAAICLLPTVSANVDAMMESVCPARRLALDTAPNRDPRLCPRLSGSTFTRFESESASTACAPFSQSV